MSDRIITHASVFSGIGASEIAAEMLGWENLFHCEINKFCREVLDYHFPNAASYEDITKTDFSEWRGKVTVLTGGFPCQPFSYAGKRKGTEDNRYLWPYMLHCIEQIRPTWFVGENVAGIASMAFPGKDVKVGEQADLFGEGDGYEIYERREKYVLSEICRNLESVGYSVQAFVIPACAVGAPHRRDRVFIVAHRLAENTVLNGCLEREHDKQKREWNKWNVSAGSDERICRKTMEGTASDSKGSSDAAGKPRKLKGKVQRKRISKRHSLQQFVKSNNVRSCMERTFANSDGFRQSAFISKSRQQGTTMDRKCKNVTFTKSCRFGNKKSFANSNSRGRREIHEHLQSKFTNGAKFVCDGRKWAITDSTGKQSDRFESEQSKSCGSRPCQSGRKNCKMYDYMQFENRWRNFPTVSAVYRGNDGIPFDVDSLSIPFNKWRKESLKAYGNAIVPQVIYEIFLIIDEIEKMEKT